MRRVTRQQLAQFSTILLDTMRHCLLRHGMTKQDYDTVVLQQKSSSKSIAPFGLARRGKHLLYDGGAYGAVLRSWRTQRNYVDVLGNPRELPKDSKSICLKKLLRAHGFRGVEETAIDHLQKIGAIAKTSKRKFILLESSSAKIHSLDESACVHASKCIDAYISTVLFNLTTSDPKHRMPEKRTEVLLPLDMHDEYRNFSQRQLTSVAHTIDDWLETKAKSHPKSKRYSAGALLVGYSSAPVPIGKTGKKRNGAIKN